MKEVKWGIIGAGDVTEVKSGPAFNKIENSQIIGVMRRNLDKAKDYAERHGIPKYTNDADELLRNPEINAIYVATPPSTHAEYTIRAAQAGKHVYVEKPMATTFNECEEMIEACKRFGVKLFVAYYRRAMDYFNKIKELLNENIIGDVKFIDLKLFMPPNENDYDKNNLPWRVNKKIAGGGYFYDLASHQFDLLDYLFDPIKSVTGQKTNQLNLYEVEDIVAASFLFESNIIGSGLWCFTVSEKDKLDEATIYGSKGQIKFSFFSQTPIEVILEKKKLSFQIEYPIHVQKQLIETVVKDILGKGKCISTGISGARTNKILETIIEK